MENRIKKEGQLILVGKAIKCFDSNLQPTVSNEYKFLIIKSPEDILPQILVMEEFEPFVYHAQALLCYMEENNLNEVVVNGGGKINFYLNDLAYKIYGKSYSFDIPCVEEVSQISNQLWPKFRYRIDIISSVQDINISGEICTFEKVKYYVDNP